MEGGKPVGFLTSVAKELNSGLDFDVTAGMNWKPAKNVTTDLLVPFLCCVSCTSTPL